jgi:hypothetical protein
MNVILGSGLIAFIAKKIFPDYTLIPLGKSRYYQFEVSTCDDYIFCHDSVDEFIKNFVPKTELITTPVFYKRALSYSGQLVFNKNESFTKMWLNKVYGDDLHPNAYDLTIFDSFVYSMSCSDMFKVLEKECKKDFRKFVEVGDKIKSIDTESRTIYTKNTVIEYENIISTIPLDGLYNLCGVEVTLPSKDLHTFIAETDNLDFEGASELLVVDGEINFHKCTRIGRSAYQFFTTNDIPDIPALLNLILKKYELLSATVVRKAIPIGNHKLHEDLLQHGITCVGSNAQWDDMMDVSSCIKRLMRIKSELG